MRGTLGWLPSAGLPVTPAQLAAIQRTRDPERALSRGLRERLDVRCVSLRASGRDALRCLLASASAHTGRDEIVVPAYTCFSVAAAAVASGLRVRLVDVTEDGLIDRKALERVPLERAAALVVCNLFGLAEPIAALAAMARAAGALVIDDAAQALGSRGADGHAGARGDAGVLSFGRGKPLAGLGGGAILWTQWPGEIPTVHTPRPLRGKAALRAAVYDLALVAPVFRALSSIPALGIGETHFDVDFRRGPIDAASLAIAAAVLPSLDEDAERRARDALRLAALLSERTSLRPLLATGGTRGVYPRLFALAQDGAAREAALEILRPHGAGATGLYPSALDRVVERRPHLRDLGEYPGAADLAARLITLPTHGRLRGRRLAKVVELLAG